MCHSYYSRKTLETAMGGPTSTRWNGHRRAPLVEDTPTLSLTDLRRGGLFDEPDRPLTLSWIIGDAPLARADVRLLGNADGPTGLTMDIDFADATEPLRAELELVAQPCHFGGVRWFFACPEPDCERRALKLYIDPGGRRICCRRCLGLTHRSAQQHDKPVDQARRDPVGFEGGRQSSEQACCAEGHDDGNGHRDELELSHWLRTISRTASAMRVAGRRCAAWAASTPRRGTMGERVHRTSAGHCSRSRVP